MDLNDNGAGGIWVFDEVELPDGWAFDQLGNRCTVRRGSSPRPAGHPRYFGGGKIPWIKIGDATNTGSRFIERTAEHVNEEGAKCSVLIPAGSLIIANSGVSLGFAAITRVPGCIHDGWLLTTDFRELDRDYLYYCINVATRRLRQLADGTTQPNLNTGIARRLMLPLPPLAEQKAIAGVLGALDDKIELNRRMNATLEAMARALFQSWFVDFDPVRAHLDGRTPVGMAPATAALFPSHLEDSPLGHIPKGWTVGRIQDCCVQIQNGGTPRRNEPRFWDGGNIPWLASGEVRQSIITSTESFITDEGLAESSAKWVPAFSTVVALYGATAGQVSFTSSRLTTNQAVCALIPKRSFAFFNYLTMRGATAEMENKAVGSAQQNISKGIVEETQVILPPHALIERFAEVAGPLFERWISNLHQSRTLTTLRDTLLPKLLSGELSAAKVSIST